MAIRNVVVRNGLVGGFKYKFAQGLLAAAAAAGVFWTQLSRHRHRLTT